MYKFKPILAQSAPDKQQDEDMNKLFETYLKGSLPEQADSFVPGRKIAEKQEDGKQQNNTTTTLGAIGGDPLLQGLTLGWSDELLSQAAELFGLDKEEIKQASEEAVRRNKENYPKSTMLGEGIGSVATGSLTAPLTGGSGIVGKVLTGAGIGALEGGLYGAGASEQRGADKIAQAIPGAILGGAIGGGLPLAGAAVNKIAQGGLGGSVREAVDTPVLKKIRTGLGFTNEIQESAITNAVKNPKLLDNPSFAYEGIESNLAVKNPIPIEGTPTFTPAIEDTVNLGSGIRSIDKTIRSEAPELAAALKSPDPQVRASAKEWQSGVKQTQLENKAMRESLLDSGRNPKVVAELSRTADIFNKPELSIREFQNARANLWKLSKKGKPQNEVENQALDMYKQVNKRLNDNLNLKTEQITQAKNAGADVETIRMLENEKEQMGNWYKKVQGDEVFKAGKTLGNKGASSALDVASAITFNPLLQLGKYVTDPVFILKAGNLIDAGIDSSGKFIPNSIKTPLKTGAKAVGEVLDNQAVQRTVRDASMPTISQFTVGNDNMNRAAIEQDTELDINFADFFPSRTKAKPEPQELTDEEIYSSLPRRNRYNPDDYAPQQSTQPKLDDDFFDRINKRLRENN